MQQKIKLFDPIFDSKEEKTLKNVLWSHNWASGSGVGTVSKFEKKFQKYVGSDSCVAVNSGTAALHLALSNYNIKNKEVILPSLSFVSTAHAIIMNGGKPIFVDVDPKTLCLDVEQLSKSITKKTKAVLPVHFGGYPCDMDKILQISKENKLILIEDAAHAVGTSYKEKKIGSDWVGNTIVLSSPYIIALVASQKMYLLPCYICAYTIAYIHIFKNTYASIHVT